MSVSPRVAAVRPLCPAEIPFLLPTRPPHDVLLLKWKKYPGHFASFLSERGGQSSSSLPNGLMVSVRHLAAAGWLCNWFSMPLALPKLGGFPNPPGPKAILDLLDRP